jgi:predicted porin
LESTYNLNGTAKGLTGTGMNGGSEFRLGGSEDLGNGMKAEFSWAFLNNHNSGGAPGVAATAAARAAAVPVDNDINLNSVTSYNSFVGLSGDFGSIKIGQQFSPLFFATTANDAMGGAATSGNLANGGGQVANSLTYSTPSIAGVKLSVQGSNQTAATKSTGYNLTYAVGAFSASYGSNTVGTAKAINGIGANYDFGMAKLFVSSLTQSGATTATSYGVSVPFGAATLIGSASSKGTADNFTIVGKYNLSKRTVAYVQNASASKAVTNSVGIQHAF